MRYLALLTGAIACLGAGGAFAQSLTLNDGRLLGSNCMQCHATNGQPRRGGIESLEGMSYSKCKSEMAELARKNPLSEAEEEIMIVHAKAYSAAEIDAICRFISTR